MQLPAPLEENLHNLGIVAAKGYEVSGRGVLVVAYRPDEVSELHYIPLTYLDVFAEAMPYVEQARGEVENYTPQRCFILVTFDMTSRASGSYEIAYDDLEDEPGARSGATADQ